MSETWNADFEMLRDTLLDIAETQLDERESCSPFGASIETDGELALTYHEPDVELVLDVLRAKAARGAIRATGYCCTARTRVPGETRQREVILACIERSD